MSRSARHKEKYGKSSEILQDHYHEGTAARTRPLSFDEIMLKRKNKKKQFENEKEGVFEDITADGSAEKVSHHYGSDRVNSRSKDSSPGVQKHLSEEDAKASSKKKEENTYMKGDYVAKSKDRKIRDSETKSNAKMDKDQKVKGKNDEKIYDRRKRNEQRSNNAEYEASKKHSRELTVRDRHVDESRGNFERENKRKYGNGVYEQNRDRYSTRKLDPGKRHDSEASDRKERKELSKSHFEELKLKRRRLRGQERVDRIRRSISPLPRLQKRASYYGREHGEPSPSHIGRSGWQQSDLDKSQIMNNGLSGHYKRQGGSNSGLGGYSPRKRRTEAAAKTPSPTKHSPPAKRPPEKKNAKWDRAPEGADNTFSVSVPSSFQPSNQTASSNIREAVSTVPVASATVKPLSVGSFNILSSNKNDSVDSVQLTQATRPMRRLYVENVPASASEKAVMECLNNFLISSCVNHIRGSQPCISCIINKEKGQALVEFLTPEDASAALAFDGSSFSGSIIKIRRPKDFVEVATGEPEKSVIAVNALSNIVKDSPHKIFIGGIPKAFSSKMIMEIASTYGPLKAYGFESSDNLNEPYAFLEYADHSVTFKACMGLNGMKLGGQVITAVQAVPNASTLETSGKPPFYRIPEQAMPLLKKPTQVLKLKNVFDPEALPLLSHTEIEEILEDVRLECGRFGTVKSVNAVKCDATPISTSVACGVNEDMEPAGSQQNLVFKETNAKTETMETVDCKIVEGSDAGDGKPTSNLMEDNPGQPGSFNVNMAVGNLCDESVSNSQELAQQASKDGSDFSDDKVIDNSQMKDSSVEDKLPNGEGSYLEVVGGNMKESSVGDHRVGSDAIEKGEHEEQSCDLDHIFEPGCVFVEFSRTEASCMAAHCLHGRLFDNRTVTVEYVPLDVYQIRFPK
ncbi:hypothetical protein P3X46_027496 [Hevea brasiliensis]|uniref:RRM domain-containing protein n=1 Tax=Hevea brasiliensis TaxID=3981 RepID=A0ABQ9KZZ9_HEVBR|nr:splicing factor U2af large subunit A [Hevea brasiliensis]XP_021667623.2 splicing factor U2af large subunit A [Hevea brasiliensis]XP_021667624.2 splicing factor U2af large subunit A [Hevea brasiliensis]XP_021667625.2 splicing factor U2af large subunit A [Hevea brasiliensis]XP_021667626.2 splicing factor U2af large subunit A [Hevea brasiliensis]KAJ9154128.1 hypothetical protein P3X46_027496 [Hevea brasiliensis]